MLLDRGASLGAVSSAGDGFMAAAVLGGSKRCVELALASGCDVSYPGENGLSSLMLASQICSFKVVEKLLDLGADIHAKAKDGSGALTKAASSGSDKSVVVLLAAGADPNASDNRGGTPLMAASEAGSIGSMAALIVAGARIDAKDAYGCTALMGLMGGERDLAAKWLIGQGTSLEVRSDGEWGMTALDYACQAGWAGHIDNLMSAGAMERGCGFEGQSAYATLVESDNGTQLDACAKVLSKHGADIDAFCDYGKRVLDKAMPKSAWIFRLVLEWGADVGLADGNGQAILDRLCAWQGEFGGRFKAKKVEALLDHGARIGSGLMELIESKQGGASESWEHLVAKRALVQKEKEQMEGQVPVVPEKRKPSL